MDEPVEDPRNIIDFTAIVSWVDPSGYVHSRQRLEHGVQGALVSTWICGRCGVVVTDTILHRNWHVSLGT